MGLTVNVDDRCVPYCHGGGKEFTMLICGWHYDLCTDIKKIYLVNCFLSEYIDTKDLG